MRFVEVDLFGVYVAPISVILVAAWIVTIGLRRVADHFNLMRFIWHPSLFVGAFFLIVMSLMVLFAAR